MRNDLWKPLLICLSVLLLTGITLAQHEQEGRVFTISGHAGQATVIEIGGRAYVDVEGLTQIMRGALSFSANHIILSLPASVTPSSATEPAAERAHSPVSDSALSRDFMRAGIEEIATMREWASTLGNAIQNGYQVTENWTANYREQTVRDLRLASAAASTDADRNALQLLTNEFDAVREWSSKLVHERQSMDTAKYSLSPNALRDDPSSQKIITCGHFLAAMLGSGSFQDDPSCH
jgi:hypothetical protein